MTSINNDSNRVSSKDFRDKGMWTMKVGSFMYWYEYLVLSPSYELARRYNSGELTPEDELKLPEDFDVVLAVYDDFDDVLHTNYLTWWRERGMALCALKGEKPDVSIVTVLKQASLHHHDPCEKINNYMENEWMNGGRQNTVLFAVPMGLPKTQITRQVIGMLDQLPDWAKRLGYPKPKYTLASKRENLGMLFRYLRVVTSRAAMPELTLWQIGALVEVSDTYSSMFDLDTEVAKKKLIEERKLLTILTSRAFKRGHLISENAARGVFPSYAPCPHAVDLNFDELAYRCETIVRD